MSRGTIMALDNHTAVVLTPDGEFVRVRKLPGYEIGAEITYRVRRSAVKLRRWLQGSAGAAVLLAFFFGFWLMQPPSVVAYVSMDINPSVEIGLDKDMHVRKLRAVNSDAEAIIAEVKFKGQDLETVIQAIAAKLVAANLLTAQGSEIVIASVPVKSIAADWESQVAEKMKAVLSEAAKPRNDAQAIVDIEVTAISVPLEIRKFADEQGISSGKMAFWLAAETQGHDVSIDALKQQSLKKIAADWGGVDKVLGDDAKKNTDAKVWKERLDEGKNKLSSLKGKAPAAKPTGDDDDGKHKEDDNKNGDNSKDDKRKDDKLKEANQKDDKKKSDDKKKDDDKQQDEDKRNIGGKKKGDDNKNEDKDERQSDGKRKDDDKRIDKQKSRSSGGEDGDERGQNGDRGDKSRNNRDNRED